MNKNWINFNFFFVSHFSALYYDFHVLRFCGSPTLLQLSTFAIKSAVHDISKKNPSTTKSKFVIVIVVYFCEYPCWIFNIFYFLVINQIKYPLQPKSHSDNGIQIALIGVSIILKNTELSDNAFHGKHFLNDLLR